MPTPSLPGLKFMRTLWVCQVSGGPFQFTATKPGATPLGLEEAHRDLRISPAEFDEVAAELGRTLDHFKVPKREKDEVLAAFAAHKGEVTAGYVPRRGTFRDVQRLDLSCDTLATGSTDIVEASGLLIGSQIVDECAPPLSPCDEPLRCHQLQRLAHCSGADASLAREVGFVRNDCTH
jgi:hypothetical protein